MPFASSSPSSSYSSTSSIDVYWRTDSLIPSTSKLSPSKPSKPSKQPSPRSSVQILPHMTVTPIKSKRTSTVATLPSPTTSVISGCARGRKVSKRSRREVGGNGKGKENHELDAKTLNAMGILAARMSQRSTAPARLKGGETVKSVVGKRAEGDARIRGTNIGVYTTKGKEKEREPKPTSPPALASMNRILPLSLTKYNSTTMKPSPASLIAKSSLTIPITMPPVKSLPQATSSPLADEPDYFGEDDEIFEMALSQLADDTMNTTSDTIQNTTAEISKVLPRAAIPTTRLKEVVPRSVPSTIRASPRLKIASDTTTSHSTSSTSRSIKALPALRPPTNNPTSVNSKLPTVHIKSIPPLRNPPQPTKVYQVTSDPLNQFRFSKAAALPPQITKKLASPRVQVTSSMNRPKSLPLPVISRGIPCTAMSSKALVATTSDSNLRGGAGGMKGKKRMEELLKKEMEDLERCGGLMGEWMGCSLVAILDLKGKSLIQRSYRDDIPSTAIERFLPLVLEQEEEGAYVTPCFSSQGINYLHIRHNNLYLVALTKKNSNAAELLTFLHKLTSVLTEYFKELEEESIRDNFVIIYELLDEMMDFGYPQTTESKILQEYITQESHKLEVQVRPPMAVTNAVSWRSEGIRYRKNEVFLDVVESVNLLVNTNGNVVRSEILGAVKMKCYLSGMPELRLGLNDKVMFESTGRTSRGKAIEMEDVKFHQCVRLSRFENDRTISFIPPDGEFELMSYRLNTQVKPLIWAEAVIESHSGSRIEYVVKVKAQFKRRSTANNVEVYIPVPEDADSPKFRAGVGTVHYVPEKSAFVWKIKQLAGGKDYLMRAQFGLPSVRGEEVDKRAPITIKFEIPYFTVSGIQVRYLKIVEKSGYQALPWVRYITQHGDDYSLRTNQQGAKQLNPTTAF